jgi:hypothetical protein
MKKAKLEQRPSGGARTRGRPPNPLTPLRVQLDPHIKLDYLTAANELHVPLSVLVEHLLVQLRGPEVGTSRIRAAFAEALASHARQTP